jgi:hypothetical protein
VLAAEVFDNDDEIVVRLEAPDMDRKDFDVQVVADYRDKCPNIGQDMAPDSRRGEGRIARTM